MSIAHTLLPEFDHEMAGTRRMLALVPAADADWKPHSKSMALGELAAHLAVVPLWGRMTMERTELDLGDPVNAGMARVTFTTTADLLEHFDRNVSGARTALAAASDSDMSVEWTLKHGARTVFSMPRAAVLRGFVLSHLIHHRGQLSVYLRQRDVPLPSLYGPTADARG